MGLRAWRDYKISEIPLGADGPAYARLHSFDVVGDDLIGAWFNDYPPPGEADGTITCTIGRLSIAGGDLKLMGHFDKTVPANFTATSFCEDGVAVAEAGKGLYVIQNGKSSLLRVADGLPEGKVESIGWLDKLLYLGFDGSLVQFDPRSHSFATLFSARAVAPKQILDGGVEYCVAGILPDPARHYLWISIKNNTNYGRDNEERAGLWKVDPVGKKFELIDRIHDPGTPQWSGKAILYDFFQPRLLDPATDKIDHLVGYDGAVNWVLFEPRNGAVFKDVILLAQSGYLCTPDGMRGLIPSEYSMFDCVEPSKHGFVVAGRNGKLYLIHKGGE